MSTPYVFPSPVCPKCGGHRLFPSSQFLPVIEQLIYQQFQNIEPVRARIRPYRVLLVFPTPLVAASFAEQMPELVFFREPIPAALTTSIVLQWGRVVSISSVCSEC